MTVTGQISSGAQTVRMSLILVRRLKRSPIVQTVRNANCAHMESSEDNSSACGCLPPVGTNVPSSSASSMLRLASSMVAPFFPVSRLAGRSPCLNAFHPSAFAHTAYPGRTRVFASCEPTAPGIANRLHRQFHAISRLDVICTPRKTGNFHANRNHYRLYFTYRHNRLNANRARLSQHCCSCGPTIPITLAATPPASTLGAMELLLSLLISIGISLIVFGKR